MERISSPLGECKSYVHYLGSHYCQGYAYKRDISMMLWGKCFRYQKQSQMSVDVFVKFLAFYMILLSFWTFEGIT